MRLHVAGATRIAVVEPGAADARRPIDHDEVAVARMLEPNAGADTAGSGADDHDTFAFVHVHRSTTRRVSGLMAEVGAFECQQGALGVGARGVLADPACAG